MKLRQVILKNFRSYRDEIRIDLDNLTAFIGKNDIGKSTILEALEIFFNNETVKIEAADASISGDKKDVLIGCVFCDLPSKVVIDASNPTSLAAEYLLNENKDLEIHKIFNCDVKASPKEKVFVLAHHPSAENYDNLLKLKIDELKNKWKSLDIEDKKVKLSQSATIRCALWKACPDLKLKPQLVPLDEADGKKIWEQLKKELPIFGLFSSDRASRDEDSEVQDPMKLAIREALKKVGPELERIKDAVEKEVIEVANQTVKKIKEMDPNLGKNLLPHFKAEPKWDSIFKLSLTTEDKIPINKRGSGIRRIVLINFFRAEVERKKKEQGSQGIIYAIEEPETSQHPNYQRMLIKALRELSDEGQVLLTTHVPGLAGDLPTKSLRYIDHDDQGKQRIRSCDESVYKDVANTLGIIPDHKVKVFVCVEGPSDVNFFHAMGKLLHQDDPKLPDLKSNDQIVVFPLGGSTLKDWVNNHYLRPLDRPEIHIYDRDNEKQPQYQTQCKTVNERDDDSWGVLTERREIENYYHSDTIKEVLGVRVTLDHNDDIPLLIAKKNP